MAEPRIPLADRFWSKVRKTETCWLWTAGVNSNGYGRFQYYNRTQRPGKGRDLYAHRVAWMLTHGAVPDGFNLLHSCDTPRCVNPDHLRIGTQKDNGMDAVHRNRTCRVGRPIHLRKLNESDILAIRSDRRTTRAIAASYGMSHVYIAGVKKGLLPRYFKS